MNQLSLRRISVRTLVSLCMTIAGFAGVIVGVSGRSASADPPTQNVALNNSTAPAGTDCPADTLHDYWHFVIAPNTGFAFFTIHLNISGLGLVNFSGGQIIPNGGQQDNVFIAVPAGKSLTDLSQAGSSADITPPQPAPRQFNLSHTCHGNTDTSSSVDESSSTSSSVDESSSTSSSVDESSSTSSSAVSTSSSTNEVAPPVPESSTASSVAGAVPTTPITPAAVQVPDVPDDGLPNTGADTSGIAWAGALLLVFGCTILILSRRPRRS